MKSLLIIITMISHVTPMINLFKRQSQDPTVLTSTVTQPPLPCSTVNGVGCYPLSQCSGASSQSSTAGVYPATPGFQICDKDSVTKEPYFCCNKIPDTTITTITPPSTTTITPETTTTMTPASTTTITPPSTTTITPPSTTTNTPPSTTTITPPSTITITTIKTTTPEPPFECAKIKTPGFGVNLRRNAAQATAIPFILGGENAGKDNYPYMAAFLGPPNFMNRTKTRCGASIIGRRSLLTAAHCFIDLDPGEKLVAVIGDYILGNSSDGNNATEVEVERIILHEDYKEEYYYNDIAIVVLKTALNFSESIAPVCLPSKQMVNEPFAGLNAIVTGWGRDAFSGRDQTTLQSASIPVVTQQECQEAYLTAPEIREKLPNGITIDIICAGLYNDTRRDSCVGDSGGPLVASDQNGVQWIQIGIVSSGIECGQAYPGLYTRTTEYLDWIAANRVP